MYEYENHYSIDFREIFRIIKKRLKFLFIVPIIFGIIGAAISIYIIQPVYESSSTIIVRQIKNYDEEINKSDVDLSKSLIYTYAEMAKSDTVLENTKQKLHLTNLSGESIKVSPVKDTQILKIEVQNTNPQLASQIANTLVEEFTKEIVRITKTDNVAVVDYAKLPKEPIKPNKTMNIIFSAILGGILVLMISFLAEYLDNSFKNEKEIKKYLELPVIGSVQNFNKGGRISNEYNQK